MIMETRSSSYGPLTAGAEYEVATDQPGNGPQEALPVLVLCADTRTYVHTHDIYLFANPCSCLVHADMCRHTYMLRSAACLGVEALCCGRVLCQASGDGAVA